MSKLFKSSVLFILLLACSSAGFANSVSSAATEALPVRVGDFTARGPARLLDSIIVRKTQMVGNDFGVLSAASRDYVSAKDSFSVTISKMRSDTGAYALLNRLVFLHREVERAEVTKLGDVGTEGYALYDEVEFFKGPAFVTIISNKPSRRESLVEFARSFAETLDKGEGEIPVLVKHLPEWETAQERARYAVSLNTLREAAGTQSVFDAIDFQGGAEAVIAPYGQSRLVIVEYNTPQLATDNDGRINARIKELREAGQAVPTAYKRIGNYSVFVFDAPDEQTAARLINGIQYEKTVQWLGNNPNDLKRAQRNYTETTAGIILAVLEASGLSLLLCLGIGGIFGGIVFLRRRARQGMTEAYTDAGGMLRLNLDEMTPVETNPSRLLGRGDG